MRVNVGKCLQVLAKTLDSTQLTTDKLEVSTITRDEKLGRVSRNPAKSCMHDRTGCVSLTLHEWNRSTNVSAALQVVYKVYEDVDLEPLLTEVNAIRKKEKDEES